MSLLGRRQADEILFHHRFPTSTINVRNGCHPYSTKEFFDNNYVLVHNGVLFNDEILREEHEKLGIKYVSTQDDGSFNDSEALLWDVALYLEGRQAKLKAEGNIAFIVIKRDSKGTPTALHFGRNVGSPLRMKHTKKSLTLSSETTNKSDQFVETNRLYTLDYKTLTLTSEYLYIPSGYVYGFHKNTGTDLINSWDDELDEIGSQVKSMSTPFTREKDRLLKDACYVYDDALSLAEWELDAVWREIEVMEAAERDGRLSTDDLNILSTFRSEADTLKRVKEYFEETCLKYGNPKEF